MSAPGVSVVIPTFARGAVLLDTLAQLLALEHAPVEIVVVDQTGEHEQPIAYELGRLDEEGAIRWIRRQPPGITAAMNHGVREARAPVILFLDDDVRLKGELVHAHALAHVHSGAAIVAGQVIQPWEQPLPAGQHGYPAGREREPDAFRFNATEPGPARRFIGCNVSMWRETVLALGGFDENFRGVAYRFEADFAERVHRHGHRIVFEPGAGIDHLKVPSGGIRRFRSHLRTLAPWHSMGRFYYCLRHVGVPGVVRATLEESLRTVAGRDHLRRPWWIPVSALAELGGLTWALGLCLRGPRLGLSAEPRT